MEVDRIVIRKVLARREHQHPVAHRLGRDPVGHLKFPIFAVPDLGHPTDGRAGEIEAVRRRVQPSARRDVQNGRVVKVDNDRRDHAFDLRGRNQRFPTNDA
jgi:hypothetical protein